MTKEINIRKEELLNLEQLDNINGGAIGKKRAPTGYHNLINKIKDFFRRLF